MQMMTDSPPEFLYRQETTSAPLHALVAVNIAE